MSLRARFFDDWRLSRIDEEVERLSINSDTSVAVESISPSLRAVQRSASAEGVVQSEDDDDDDEPPLPPPPSPLPLVMMKDAELDTKYLRRLDQETEALRFLQVKYDTLGKVNVEKRQIPITSQQTPSTTSGTGEAAAAAGPQCQLNCDCSLASAGDQRPRMAVDSSSFPQSSTASRGSVAERRKPPPPPSTNRRQCSCPTSASETGSCTDRLHLSADDYRHHHHHHHHQHHHQQQQRHLEQFSHPQHCSQTSSASVHQSQEGSDGGQPGRLAALCSCHGDPLRRGGSGGSVERQCCPLLLSNAELFQIDLFYRSRKTFVYVCPCPAVLYFASAASAGRGSGGVASSMSWRFAAAGVPVIVVDTMRGASVGSRLHLVLAERGTGFELWRYRLTDGVQQYAVGEASTPGGDGGTASAFHTVTVSTGHVAGLCFDDAVSAGDFHRQLLRLDELYSTGGGGSRNRKGKKTRREVVSDAAAAGVGSSCISSSNRGLQGRSKCRTVISKADISQPCCFTHVTRLERGGSRNTAVSSAAADISQRTLAGQTAAVGRTQRIFSSLHS